MAILPHIGITPGLYGYPGVGMTHGVYSAQQLATEYREKGNVNCDNIHQIISECISYNPDATNEILSEMAWIFPQHIDIINKYAMLT